jgi:NitT/TauT family transport system substrate-binding protein
MRVKRRKFLLLGAGALASGVIKGCNRGAAPGTVRIPRGAGGVGFLPLLVMEKERLIQKHAPGLEPDWIPVGGPSAVNGALLSGAIDFVAAGPPAFLILWDRTRDNDKVMGVSAITSLPMYLNANVARLQTLDDFKDNDKIAVTAVKVSIPAIAMQMHAEEKHGPLEWRRFDRLARSMTHGNGVNALLGGSGAISAHFTSPPFYQRELKDPKVHKVITTNDIMKGSSTFTMLSTTTAFYEKNPKVVAAVLAALEEANQKIRDDKKWAADVLFHATAKSSFKPEDMFEVVSDPAVKFTTTPENIMKYGEFMHRVGTIKKKPSNWKEMFFPEIYGAQGN